ncbi:MAG: SAM-dependent methyltransferase [Burkholderiaceae bacterium]|nr:SAM-dependent methyltransferase [Burkholderiaceae bacterium]
MTASAASPSSPSAALVRSIARAIEAAGGWLPFDRFMALALYAPGLGYYANAGRKFGAMPESGSDFVTAPGLSPLFGQTLAVALAEALERTGTHELWEFGAGSGALARELLGALGERITRYTIVELSGALRERQQQALAAWGDKVCWADALPARIEGVIVGNEVLDAMPVQLLARHGSDSGHGDAADPSSGPWFERGVTLAAAGGPGEHNGTLVWSDRPTRLRPPVEIEGTHDYLSEIHPQANAFIATLAGRLARGAAYFIDYGFPEQEYYHPQRCMGTLMCHRAHRSDADPLTDVGLKDISAHVDFSGIALAGQNAGLSVLGYCTQGRFLINCGLAQRMQSARLPERAQAARLIHEHEMGELFKVIGFAAGAPWDAIGFRAGDRTHTL